MNLSALQFADINNSVEAVAVYENRAIYTKDTNLQTPLLTAKPLFQNSLLSTEVSVSVPAMTANHYAHSSANTPNSQLFPITETFINTSLHYRLQDPMPSYLGSTLYQTDIRCVAIVTDVTTIKGIDTPLVRQVQLILNRGRCANPPSDMPAMPCFVDSQELQERKLWIRSNTRHQIKTTRLSQLCDRLSVFGKTDFIFSDCSGIAIDAIRSSVPTGFIADVPKGFQWIQDCLFNYLEHGNREQLIREQHEALQTIIRQKKKTDYIVSNRSTLHSLIYTHTAMRRNQIRARQTTIPAVDIRAEQHVVSNSSAYPCDKLILCTQQSVRSKEKTSVKMKSGIESSRRKFQKLRESPTRFMEDSQISLLRSLASNKNQQ